MKRRRHFPIRYLLCLLILFGVSLFFLKEKPTFKERENIEQVSATIAGQRWDEHEFKRLIRSFKEIPGSSIPKHPSPGTVKELQETIDSILEHEYLEGSITGVSVRDDSGKLLYDYNGNLRLIPASNIKIISAVAALEVLGADYQFSTEIIADGEIKNGILRGDLYIVGKGDPTLQAEDFEALAKEVKQHGIQRITGSVYADDSWYDNVRYSQDLSWRHEYNYVGNAVSALTVAANDDYLLGTVILDVSPAKEVGEKPEITITPNTDYVTVINKGITSKEGSTLTLSDYRRHGLNEFIVEGEIPMDSAHYQRWRAVWEPSGYALDLFLQGLQKENIRFSKESISIKKAPQKIEPIITRKSIPLKDIIIPFMKQSNNGLGEVFIKEIGKVILNEGSWDAGLDIVRQVLKELSLDVSKISLRDGSGMSERNLVPANFFTELLTAIQFKDWFQDFEKSLPLAGERNPDLGGTFSYRFVDEAMKGRVKAKTGNLNRVSTLSGYVDTKDGHKLNFSILMNNFVREPVTPIQDEIVTVLSEINLK